MVIRRRLVAFLALFSLIVGFTISSTSMAGALPPSPTVPDAPTALVAYRGNSSAEIAFTAGANGGLPITNYKYQIDDGSWIAFSPAVTTPSVTIGGLTNGTTYSVKLRAVNMVGDGAVSDAVSVTPAAVDAVTWTARTASEANTWWSVAYGNGVFVAVAEDGASQVMTSPDGVTWTARTAAAASSWDSVTYGNGVFVAVAYDGTNRVMTSPDGVTWTARSAAEANNWTSVTYGNGLFVAVAGDAASRAMTSPDGVTWTARTSAFSRCECRHSVAYGNGVFVAVASSGTNRVMTSSDGVTWTARTAAAANAWRSVTYGSGVFVAVANSGTDRVMTAQLIAAPNEPTSLVATSGDGSASIAFTAGADGGTAISKYQYKVGNGAWTDAVGTTSPITITGLTNYATVNIRLRAVNAVGAGAASAAVKVWPRVAGPSLASVKAAGSTGIRAAFAALTPVGGTVSHYWVYAYAKGTSTVVSSCRSTAAARGCLINGLSSNTEYDVAVRGFFTLTGSPDVRPTTDSTRQTVRTNS